MKNRKCIAKAKTAPARRTLDPLYQQQLTFREDYRQCVLQVSYQYPSKRSTSLKVIPNLTHRHSQYRSSFGATMVG